MGNEDKACSVNIACRASSLVLFFPQTFAFLSTFQILSYLLKQFCSDMPHAEGIFSKTL